VLDARRALDARLLRILDRFYARLPGWEDDPVALAMAGHILDMSESAVAAERDLWDACALRDRIAAARTDYRTGAAHIDSAAALLRTVISELLAARTANVIDIFRHGHAGAVSAAADAHERLRSAKVAAAQAAAKAKLAGVCAAGLAGAGGARAAALAARLLPNTAVHASALGSAGLDVLTRRTIVRALADAKAALVAAEGAAVWVAARDEGIAKDLVACRQQVAFLERDVLLERMALLRMHCREQDFRGGGRGGSTGASVRERSEGERCGGGAAAGQPRKGAAGPAVVRSRATSF
jgi:hypothetical protein